MRLTHAAGTSLTATNFGDLCFFGSLQLEDDEGSRYIAAMPDGRLDDIRQRWRIYQAHSFLAVALQSFLVACVRLLRNHRGGVSDDALMAALNATAIASRFQDITGVDLPLRSLILRQEAHWWPVISIRRTGRTWFSTGRSSKTRFPSAGWRHFLVEGEAEEGAGIAFAAILLFQVVLRHSDLTVEPIQNWYRRQVYDPYSDVSIAVIADFLKAEFGNDWIDRPNGEILRRIIWRFVIRQHQTMSYEWGFGGTAPLFQLDGTTVIGTSTDYADPQSPHPRFPRALQILEDLGLIEDDDEIGYRLTEDGETWLNNELSHLN